MSTVPNDVPTQLDLRPLIELREEVASRLDELERRLAVDDPEAMFEASEILDREEELTRAAVQQLAAMYEANGWAGLRANADAGLREIVDAIRPTGDLSVWLDEARDRVDHRAAEELIGIFDEMCKREPAITWPTRWWLVAALRAALAANAGVVRDEAGQLMGYAIDAYMKAHPETNPLRSDAEAA